MRHEECRGLLKHVLKPYDNRSDRQFDIVEIAYDFSITRAARATKIACDHRKQKSYRVNRPLGTLSIENVDVPDVPFGNRLCYVLFIGAISLLVMDEKTLALTNTA